MQTGDPRRPTRCHYIHASYIAAAQETLPWKPDLGLDHPAQLHNSHNITTLRKCANDQAYLPPGGVLLARQRSRKGSREYCAPGTPVAVTPYTLQDSGSRSAAPQARRLHLGRGPQLLGKTFENHALGYWGCWSCVLVEVNGEDFDGDIRDVSPASRVYVGSCKGQGIRGQLM